MANNSSEEKLTCIIIDLNYMLPYYNYCVENNLCYLTKTYFGAGKLLFVHKYISLKKKFNIKLKKDTHIYKKCIPETTIFFLIFYENKNSLVNFIKLNKFKEIKELNFYNDVPKFYYQKEKSKKIIDDIIKNKKNINETHVSEIIKNKLFLRILLCICRNCCICCGQRHLRWKAASNSCEASLPRLFGFRTLGFQSG